MAISTMNEYKLLKNNVRNYIAKTKYNSLKKSEIFFDIYEILFYQYTRLFFHPFPEKKSSYRTQRNAEQRSRSINYFKNWGEFMQRILIIIKVD